ncbi:MAG: NAD(P)/FAD-dependent oxidoreductase [Spirochaetes bacterium]|nr:NAD(P)/FAD-dependent oxidoreductase [Spirochaetota bacterium]
MQKTRQRHRPQKYDVLISGAGPTGLTAAILSARSGLSVLVCEKGNVCGPRPRAETVYNHSIFEKVLGGNAIPQMSHYATAKRKFNSPQLKNSFEIELPPDRTSYVFEWCKFISSLEKKAKSLGVEFTMNTEMVAPIMENDVCIGALSRDGKKFFARTVLACDGHSSQLGKYVGIPYEKMNSIIVKNIVSGCKDTYDGFEYFFIGMDELNAFVPIVAFVFPRGNNKFETGIYLPAHSTFKLGIIPSKLDNSQLLALWHLLKRSYPRLSVIMKGTKNHYESVETVPSGMLFKRPSPVPGLILLGDAIGFLDPTGVSGIITSMENARFALEFINRHRHAPWSWWLAEKYNREFSKFSLFKSLSMRYTITKFFNTIVFAKLKTADRINKFWWLIKLAYRFK